MLLSTLLLSFSLSVDVNVFQFQVISRHDLILLIGPEIDVDLPSGKASALSPDAGLDLSGDLSTPDMKGKTKGGLRLPQVEGTIDLNTPGHIGLDADLSPSSSRTNTLTKPKGAVSGGGSGTWISAFSVHCSFLIFSSHRHVSFLCSAAIVLAVKVVMFIFQVMYMYLVLTLA